MSGNGILVTGTHEPASAGLNPLPVIVTPAPTVPELGLRMIEGAMVVTVVVVVTETPFVKPAEAESEATPVTVIVYNPLGGDEPTVNNPVTVPVALSVQVEGEGKVPVRVFPTPSVTPAQFAPCPFAKPDPEMDTTVPAGPELGLRTMRGTTEKLGVLDAASPPGSPVTVNE